MGKRKTHECFVKEVCSLVGNEYDVLDEYKGVDVKIGLRHNSKLCNYFEFKVRPNDFLSKGSRCPKCGGTKKKIHEEFLKEVYDLVGSEYAIIEEYKNAVTKILIKHNNSFCNNHTFKMKPSNFLNGSRCPMCTLERKRKKRAFSNEQFKHRIFEEFGGEFTTEDKYNNNRTEMRFTRPNCGHTFVTTWKLLLRNRKCPICSRKNFRPYNSKSHDVFVREIYDLVKDEYTVVGKYKSMNKKVRIRHNKSKCNFYEYDVYPYNFYSGYRCPKCNNPSRGEEIISRYLDKNKILYKLQYKFNDCKNINPLPFDFAIFNNKNDLLCLIEYDGKQHFEPVNFGGISDETAIENFKKIKENDCIKTNYCKNKKIPLLRIPYWEYKNINKKLDSFFRTTKEANKTASFLVLKEEVVKQMKGYTPTMIKENKIETNSKNNVSFIELGVKQCCSECECDKCECDCSDKK